MSDVAIFLIFFVAFYLLLSACWARFKPTAPALQPITSNMPGAPEAPHKPLPDITLQETAGLNTRALALSLDGIFLFLLLSLPLQRYAEEWVAMHEMLADIILAVCALIYYVLFLSSPLQATPGKYILGVRVVMQDGTRVSPVTALTRYLLFVGPSLLLIFFPPPLGIKFSLSGDKSAGRVLEIEMNALQGNPITDEDRGFLEKYTQNVRSTVQPADGTQKGVSFAYLLEILCAAYTGLLALMIGTTPANTGFHDLICKTRVVRGRGGS